MRFVIFVFIVYEFDQVRFCCLMILSVRLHVDLSLSKGYTGARCNWPIFNSGAPEAEHTGSNKGKGQAATQPSHCLGVSQVSLLAYEGGQPFQKNVGRFPRCSCASKD